MKHKQRIHSHYNTISVVSNIKNNQQESIININNNNKIQQKSSTLIPTISIFQHHNHKNNQKIKININNHNNNHHNNNNNQDDLNNDDHNNNNQNDHNDIEVKKQLKNKFKTFTNWNYREAKVKKNNKMNTNRNNTNTNNKDNDKDDNNNSDNMLIKALLNISQRLQNKSKTNLNNGKSNQNKPNPNNPKNNQNKSNPNNTISLTPISHNPTFTPKPFQQLSFIKTQRRQRFKKSQNPILFIKHYIEKQNFKPNNDEMYLIQKTIQLKKLIDGISLTSLHTSNGNNFELEKLLQSKLLIIIIFQYIETYHLMNIAVDCNQLRYLNLLILLTAKICLQCKDYTRSFYFYNQSRVAATYAHLSNIKTQSIMGLGKVALEINLIEQAIILFKKNLQYAWDSKNVQAELLVYDYLGQAYYKQGNIKQSKYYHTRYIQGQIQQQSSAIKKISVEMLNDYRHYIKSLQTKNISSLFIEYINIPITNTTQIPISNKIKHIYPNYQNGISPRINRNYKQFKFDDFPNIYQQIQKLLKQDYQFKTQISNPDTHNNFDSLDSGRNHHNHKKTIDFQQSADFHKIIKAKPEKFNFQKIYKYPLEQRINKVLSERTNPHWWEDIKNNTKKQRQQKIGILKDKIRIGHQSYHKYPEERKRQQSLKIQKIKQTLNKTLLDWIDPVKL